MSLFNDSLLYAADTTAVQAGDLTFGDKAGAVVAGAVVSGLGSIYNTGVMASNALGGNAETVDTYNKLAELDDRWAAYYKENQTAIDVVGFIGTSLLPGSLAVKGLNAVRAGESVGAFGRALNIPRTMQARYLSRAIDELETAGGTVFTRLNANKIGTMSWEFADQALQAAAFELGVALTMKQSPLLADDSWWDIGKGIATGAVLGGVIGGGIQALAINKSFKNAITEIDRRAMGYTAVEGSGLAKLDISAGDKAYGLLDSVMKIPDEVLNKDAILEVAFQLGSGPVSKKVINWLKEFGPAGTTPISETVSEAVILDKLANDVATGNITAATAAAQVSEFYKMGVQVQAERTKYPIFGLEYVNKYIVKTPRMPRGVDLTNPAAVETLLTKDAARKMLLKSPATMFTPATPTMPPQMR